jgi:hypothetical protein
MTLILKKAGMDDMTDTIKRIKILLYLSGNLKYRMDLSYL